MNTVCIDTSTIIAVRAQGKAEAAAILKPQGGQSSVRLIALIEEALQKAGFCITETELVVCPQGPGSFTGLRIAYAAAKAIQLKTAARFCCIPALYALQSPYEKNKEPVLSVIDAKRNRFYVQAFKNGVPASEALDISAQEALNLLGGAKKALVCGFGTDAFKKAISESKKDITAYITPYKNSLPHLSFVEIEAETLSKLILHCALAGKNLIPVNDYDGPVYVRKSDAENANAIRSNGNEKTVCTVNGAAPTPADKKVVKTEACTADIYSASLL